MSNDNKLNVNNPFLTSKKTDQADQPEVTPEEVVDQTTEQEIHDRGNSSIEDILDTVVNKPSSPDKKQISIYLDLEVAKAFEKFGKKHGKGAKSDLINNFLKKALLHK